MTATRSTVVSTVASTVVWRSNLFTALSRGLPALAVAASLLGCGDDGGDDQPDAARPDAAEAIDAAPPDASGQSVTIQFAAKVGTEAATCRTEPYAGLGTSGSEVTIDDLRFYVSNVRLRAGAEEVPVTLTQDGKWQYENVALLDFEDGTNGCSTAGTTDLNDRVIGTVPPGEYDGVVFDLGVPFELNHTDFNAVPSPLNLAAMYWGWAIGRKFLRVDLSVGDVTWPVHLGSGQCESGSGATPPAIACGRPNLPQISVSEFDPETSVLVLDLAALVASSDLSVNTGAPGCQSFPDDTADCTPLFPKLGLSFETGACEGDCNGQSAFHVE
jgi:uncharacterized repeat protein (TIGR04052 family)